MDDLRAQVSKRVKNAVRSLLLENGLDSSAVEIEETADGLTVRVKTPPRARRGEKDKSIIDTSPLTSEEITRGQEVAAKYEAGSEESAE